MYENWVWNYYVTSVESDLLSPETERERESCPHEAKLIVGNSQEQQLDTNYSTRDVFYLYTLKR